MASAEEDAIMARFARDYLSLLDRRVAAITSQLHAEDVDGVEDARASLTSLETTSVMVGAYELAGAVSRLRAAWERQERSELPALISAMALRAEHARELLRPAS